MNELSQKLDLGNFVNCELIQICVGRHELILQFFERVAVTVFAEIIHCDEFNRKNKYQNFSTAPATLSNLFSVPILSAELSESETLILEFKNKHKLKITKDENMTESYSISFDNNNVFVK